MYRLLATLVLVALTSPACSDGSGDDADSFTRGRTVYGNVCSACHGSAGEGGIGPAMDTVIATWPTCDEHVEWVTLGSDGWQREHGDTYGATNKPVTGGMPPMTEQLTIEEISAVAGFERSQYGGLAPDVATQQCDATIAAELQD